MEASGTVNHPKGQSRQYFLAQSVSAVTLSELTQDFLASVTLLKACGSFSRQPGKEEYNRQQSLFETKPRASIRIKYRRYMSQLTAAILAFSRPWKHGARGGYSSDSSVVSWRWAVPPKYNLSQVVYLSTYRLTKPGDQSTSAPLLQRCSLPLGSRPLCLPCISPLSAGTYAARNQGLLPGAFEGGFHFHRFFS